MEGKPPVEEGVSGSDDEEFRPDPRLIEAVAARLVGDDPASSLSDEQKQAAEKERVAADELERGKREYERVFGCPAPDEASARLAARYDREYRGPQGREFYRYHDSEIEKGGFV